VPCDGAAIATDTKQWRQQSKPVQPLELDLVEVDPAVFCFADKAGCQQRAQLSEDERELEQIDGRSHADIVATGWSAGQASDRPSMMIHYASMRRRMIASDRVGPPWPV
jgi:hypothetical protein